MHDSKAVANTILEKADAFQHDVNVVKLQKLLFFAHGWHLAITKLPLLNEGIEVRDFGIVVPSIYLSLRQHGLSHIKSLFQEFNTETGQWTSPTVEADQFATSLIEKIVSTYGNCTDVELSNLTHQLGDARFSKNGSSVNENTICNKKLTSHFVSSVIRETNGKSRSFFNIKLDNVTINKAELSVNPDPITAKEIAEYERAGCDLQTESPRKVWKNIVRHSAKWDHHHKRGFLRLSLEDGVVYELTTQSPRELKAILNILHYAKKARYDIISGTLASEWESL